MDFLSPTCAAQSVGVANNLLTTFLSTLAALQCNISSSVKWPSDYGETAISNGLEDYDFVIIGASTAGSVVAGRLAENPNHKVLLIEAGGDPPVETEVNTWILWQTLFTEMDWQYPMESPLCQAFSNSKCIYSSGKLLGGSHTLYRTMHLRGNSRDYDNWESAGNPGWGWKDVLPYFRKTENFLADDTLNQHGKDGPMTVEAYRYPQYRQKIIKQAGVEAGFKAVEDFVAGNDIGFGKVYGTLKDGRRMSTAKAFLTRNAPNLHVIKHAVATKIIFDDEMRADRVSFIYKDKNLMEVKAKKEIIISAGSIETPKLLMLSGIGPSGHLKSLNIPVVKDLPVGNSLQDHLRVDFLFKFILPEEPAYNFLDAYYNQLVHKQGLLGAPALDLTGFINTLRNQPYPDIQYIFAPTFNISQLPYADYIKETFLKQVKSNEKVTVIFMHLLQPKSQGCIRLRSANYRDFPLIYPNFYGHPDDIRTMLRGIKALLELEATPSIVNITGSQVNLAIPECNQYIYRSEDYWLCYLKYMSTTGYHIVGTAKMGPAQDRTTVVDSCLRVHGVKGLRVIDSSIMPNIVSANSNAATIMIGEKGADLIRTDWG